MAESAHQKIEQVAQQVGPKVDQLQQGLDNAGQAVQQQAEHLRDICADWTESLRGSVREHPLAALATAAALGMLLARLSR
ncbi:hypothetical protein [Roseateles violae]|uniref:DUF883 domain-containing protein n=1 Tax=Roseateles violae TaxID=3058042 RepID=A0ABT8DXI7_9BURK|nr:hypothetical protein [Pelomonas sp. PFR6]MDN3921542.1 hypothetical protein [Pelomonas sp. PFR6]